MRWLRVPNRVLFALVVFALLSSKALAEQEKNIQLFGQTLKVNIFGVDAAQQKLIDQQLLVELKSFEGVASELNQLNTTGVVSNPSAYLRELLQLCDKWEAATEVAFSCRLGGLQEDWQQAADKQALPDRTELRKKARTFLQQKWVVGAADIKLPDDAKKAGFKISLDGLLQAFVLDKLVKNLTEFSVKKAPGLQVISLSFANQQRCWSKAATSQCILQPSGQFLNLPLAKIAPATKALTTNAMTIIDSFRDAQKIGSYTLSKVLIPKEGWPAEFAPSAMAVASDSVTALVAARSLVAKPIAAGVQWVNAQSGTEGLVLTDSGTVFPSTGWYSLLVATAEQQPLWSSEKQFVIEYQTLDHQIAEYRRPYVALWITNSDRQLVRQLVVQGNNLRWLKEIPIWWRRYGRNNEQTVDGLARATTNPGTHSLVWDGRDDKGNKVPKGSYLLNVEAAREHGEHEVVTVPFELSGQSFNTRATGEKELGVIKVSFNQQP